MTMIRMPPFACSWLLLLPSLIFWASTSNAFSPLLTLASSSRITTRLQAGYLDSLSSSQSSSHVAQPQPHIQPPPVPAPQAPAPSKKHRSNVLAPDSYPVGTAFPPLKQPAAWAPATPPPPLTASTSTAYAFPATPIPPTQSNFEHIPILSLAHADAICNAAIQVCLRNEFKPVTVVVLDGYGNVLVQKRMDGCSPVGVDKFAHAKAYSCIVNQYPSRAFRDRYTQQPNEAAKFCQMTSMNAISGNQMAPFPGGIILKHADTILGAVGVSGAAGDEDEYCAIQGVAESEVAGLITDPVQHSCATVKD